MAVTTEFGVPLRDVASRVLEVLLFVLVFLTCILVSDCPERDTLMLLSVRAMYPAPAGWIAWNPFYGFGLLGVNDFMDV